MTGSGNTDGDDDSKPENLPSKDALSVVLERTERTLDYQLDTLADIDDKAVKIYRANILFLSIVIGLASIAVRGNGNIQSLINLNSAAGIILILLSLAAGAITYRASDMQGGIDPREIDRTFYEKQNERTSISMIVNKNKKYIEKNDTVLKKNGEYITYTTILTINALAYISMGIFVSGTVSENTPFVFALLSGLISIPIVVVYSNVLVFSDYPGSRHLIFSGLVLLVPIVLIIFQAMAFEGSVEYSFIMVPFYLLLLTIINIITGRPNVRSFFILSFVLSTLTAICYIPPGLIGIRSDEAILLTAVFPSPIISVINTVHPLDFALFILVGSLLMILDDRIY